MPEERKRNKMKKPALRSLCALFLAVLMLVAAVPALADGTPGDLYMYVRTGNSGKLHLRALPSTDSQSLGLYPNGTPVLVESITNSSWAFVQVAGRRGYMVLSCLTGVAPAYTPSPAVTPVPTEDTNLYVHTGNSGKLHLREAASQNARSLGLYPNGTAVRVTARSGAWAFVNISGVSGYMMLQFLTPTVPSQPVTPQPTAIPGTSQLMYIRTGNTGRLHLREYPSQSAASLGLFANGTPVYAVPMGNGWCQAMVNGKSGYMMLKYLVSSSDAPTAAPTAAPVPIPEGSTILYVATGNTGKLHLRENMSTDAGSLGLFPNDTAVAVIANYGAWAYVNVNGKLGYMMTRYLRTTPSYMPPAATDTAAPGQATPAPTFPPTFSATVRQPNNSFVYLRSTRSSESTVNVICQVPSGSVVTVVEWGDLWSKVRYDGMEGYMVTHYLK